MRIEFDMEELDITDTDLFVEFCKYTLNLVRDSVNRLKYLDQLKTKERNLLESDLIDWTKKPKNIDMTKLIGFISNHTVCIIRENSACVIMINQKTRFPNSKTKLSTVIKYLDKGDLYTVGTHSISNIFNSYKRNINSHLNNFIQEDMYKRSIDRVATII